MKRVGPFLALLLILCTPAPARRVEAPDDRLERLERRRRTIAAIEYLAQEIERRADRP